MQVEQEGGGVIEKLTPTEAIFGFCAWLTTRDETAIFGAKHEAGFCVPLIKQFCEANGMTSDVSPNWPENLNKPQPEAAP